MVHKLLSTRGNQLVNNSAREAVLTLDQSGAGDSATAQYNLKWYLLIGG